MNHHTTKEKSKNPYNEASRLSKMSFWWCRDIYKIGIKRPITNEDVYETYKHHKSEKISKKFIKLWQQELKRSNPSTLRMLFNAYGWPVLIFSFLFSVCETITRCLQPLLLGELLTYFADEKRSKNSAYLYAAGIVLCSLIPVLTIHPYVFYIFETTMKIKVGCSRLVYDKILRITKCTQEDGLNGKVINLLSNDFDKFDNALFYHHYIWKAPFETIAISILIYREIGITGMVGIIFIFSFIPIQSFIGKKAAHFRSQTTKRTDARVRLMNEIINGIQVIKMYTWEENFTKVIKKIRKKEIAAVKGSSYLMALIYCLWAVSRVSLFLTLITYIYTGNVLNARKVFILTAFYNILNYSMVHYWPLCLTFLAEGYISSKRLKEFLLLSETKESSKVKRIHKEQLNNEAIIFKNLTALWITNNGLKSLNYSFNHGKVYAIVGSVGSGKSSLLQVILGELQAESGSLEIHGKISYANQEAFLFEGNIRTNILFTEEYEEKRYSKVVAACGLLKDFEQFDNGDLTVVGEKGVNLSGGQKARINLARAVYRQADIYLLDDPLSAVDDQVGHTIFYECIRKFLRNKTVILVTHQLQYLREVDEIILMSNGMIEASGSYEELEHMDIFKSLPLKDQKNKNEDDFIDFKRETKIVEKVEEESQEVGKVSMDVYKNYMKSIKNIPLVIIVILSRVINQSMASFIDYFIAQWVNWEESVASNNTMPSNDFNIEEERQFYIYVYMIVICSFIVIIFNTEFTFFYSILRASKNLHDMMFRGIVNTSVQFFHQNPSGRILNRFSKDIGTIDTQMPHCMLECICFIFEFFAILVLVSLVNIYFVIPTIIMVLILYFLRHFYIKTARNIKRVESISKSPIYAHTNATLHGLSTIRASKAEEAVNNNFNELLDHNTSAYFMFWTVSRAFGFWLDIICIIYIAIITFAFVGMDNGVPGGNVGLAITQIIGLIGMTQWGIRQTAELENQMVSVERVLEYANLPSEEKNSQTKPLQSNWPTKGSIEFKNVSLFYKDEECKPAIKNLSFKIELQEKIGIIGRTGSGKSSIIQALFRMTRIEGVIEINGVDTKSIDLINLRKNISIIPQDPTLFSGTLRSNLDAFNEYSDENIWKVLELVELKETISSLSGGLMCKISDGGSNFSVGQRQLICLARALLRKNKILVLDEATANVDYETDTLIQKTINKEFSDCTVIFIAHRLHTVIKADKILVMEGGNLIEFDSPEKLLKKENGYLKKLINQTSN